MPWIMDQLLPLILFALVATVTPGGATTLATASGAHFGYRRSLPLMVGIAFGLASMAAAAAIGLASLLIAVPSLQLAMKTIGTLYLLWLAWRIAMSGPPRLAEEMARPTRFITGIWLLWVNPKGWAMTSAAALSFAALANNPSALALLLGVAFGAAAILSLSLWCVAGQLLARFLTADWQWRLTNMLLGAFLALSIIPMWLP
ncbi:LysE family translocator [Taklimakanibacter deserti]|uniref:LysE family translocator n=1 Tax=Taklimakanibacter deserti TaxID=2267839 RepID=UPI003F686C47